MGQSVSNQHMMKTCLLLLLSTYSHVATTQTFEISADVDGDIEDILIKEASQEETELGDNFKTIVNDKRKTVTKKHTLFDWIGESSFARDLKKIEGSVAYATCPCKRLLLSSLGPATYAQSAVLGVYAYYQEFNGRSAFYGPVNTHRSNRLYFSQQYNFWILGDKLGSNAGFIYNPTALMCPYMIPDRWQYFDGNMKLWYIDPTLVLRCIPS